MIALTFTAVMLAIFTAQVIAEHAAKSYREISRGMRCLGRVENVYPKFKL